MDDSLPYNKSLLTLIQPYIENLLHEIPEDLRKHAVNAYYPSPQHWNLHTSEQRQKQLDAYDLEHNPARRLERAATWWDVTMDASAWWQAESILPLNAAMLLSRHNPNTEKVEDAETNSSNEMGPDDFRRLKNIFDGASKEKPKTLKDWTAYARERGLKIHSWICDWEEWVREVDAKAAEQELSQPKAPPVSPAAALPGTPSQDDAGLKKREKQIRAIESAIAKLGYEALSIPTGGKGKLKAECKKVEPDLFGGGDDPFKEAWQEALNQNRVRTEKHNQYARK